MTIDMNKFAEAVFNMAYAEEMQKTATTMGDTAAGAEDFVSKYGPALVGLAALPMAANAGSVMGRHAGNEVGGALDWLDAVRKPNRGLGAYANDVLSNRVTPLHVGTVAGGLAGAAGAYGLYRLLKHLNETSPQT